MSRISKQIAESTAAQLVKSKKEAIASLQMDLAKQVEVLVTKKIPLEIMQVFKKHPNYLNTANRVSIIGNGWNHQEIYLQNEIPSLNKYLIPFLPEPEVANVLLQLFNDVQRQISTVKKLQTDLENTIFNLRTYKSVQENFPEAFELLPKIVNNSVQLNLSDIRNRLNN